MAGVVDLNPIDLAQEPDFRLGTMDVRPSVREVEFGDARESLEPRVMQVLVALARAKGAVVSRDDLIATCWEGRIVGEDAINRVIGRLRRLAETSAAFRIGTVARVGYRLEPAELAAPTASETRLPADPPVRLPRERSRSLAWIAAAAVAVLVLGAGAVWWFRPQPGQWTIDSFRMVVATPTYEFDPDLSPNGAMIAYSAGPAPFARHIFIRNLSNGDPIQLTSGAEDNDMHPAWSPSGDSLAFVRHREGQPCTILIKPVPAGDERIAGRCMEDDFTAVSWSPKGDAIYFADRPTPHLARRVMRLDIATGDVAEVTHPPADIVGDRQAVPSPDGTKLAFFHLAKGVFTTNILDLSTGTVTPVATPSGVRFGPAKAWLDNDTLIAPSGGLTEPALWALPLHGTPARIGTNSQELGAISSGVNGQFAIEILRDQIVLASPPDGQSASPRVFKATLGDTILPTYARDGTLAFAHAAPGALFELFVQRPGEDVHQIGALDATNILSLTWSPDGRRLAFYGLVGRQFGLFIINADGTGLRHFIQRGTIAMPAWSADARSFVVPMKDSVGWRLFRMPLSDPDRPVPISGYGWFAVRTDGNAIYALGDATGAIWRLDGTPRKIANYRRRCTDTFVECKTWAVTGGFLIFGDHRERANPKIILHSLADGSEQEVAAPGLDNADEIGRDPTTGRLLYVYDGLGDSDIALFHLTRK
jgi:Tol biopolymer transport system component/DNA-binding winged helix-turn-helix (wHTH) protein